MQFKKNPFKEPFYFFRRLSLVKLLLSSGEIPSSVAFTNLHQKEIWPVLSLSDKIETVSYLEIILERAEQKCPSILRNCFLSAIRAHCLVSEREAV